MELLEKLEDQQRQEEDQKKFERELKRKIILGKVIKGRKV